MSERRGTLDYFQEILKEEEIDGQDLVEGIREKICQPSDPPE
jgi:hypothetical protein